MGEGSVNFGLGVSLGIKLVHPRSSCVIRSYLLRGPTRAVFGSTYLLCRDRRHPVPEVSSRRPMPTPGRAREGSSTASGVSRAGVGIAPFLQHPHDSVMSVLGSAPEQCLAVYRVKCVGIDVAPLLQYLHDPLVPIFGSQPERCSVPLIRFVGIDLVPL